MIRLYKEGQGIWARGVLATTVGVVGLFGTVRAFQFFEENEYLQSALEIGTWSLSWSGIASVMIFVPFVVAGVWLYNHPKLTDLMIDTESELKNKVTWPTKKEAVNNSIVVVITCLILGLWIVVADVALRNVKDWIYGTGI